MPQSCFTHCAEQNEWPWFWRQCIEIHFLIWKSLYLYWISQKFIPMDPVDDKSSLVQVVAWHQTGDKPLPEPMMTQFIDVHASTCLNDLIGILNTLRPRQNGRHFTDKHQMHFLEWKCLNFHWYFTEIYSLESNWQDISTGPDNGLMPNRWQAIIWTNGGLVYWHIYGSFGVIELNTSSAVETYNKIYFYWLIFYLECSGK